MADRNPSYQLQSNVRTLLGLDPETVALRPEDTVAEQVRATLRSRYGPWKGDVVVQLKGKGRVLVQYFAERIDDRAERLHSQAVALVRKKDLRGAADLWDEATQRNPLDPKYSFHAGVVNFELREFEKAKSYLQKTLEVCPFHHRAHLVLGTLFLKLRKPDKAEEHLETAKDLAPDDPLARLNLGATYSILRKYEKGIREFEEAIRLNPKDPRAHLGLAKVYSLLGKHERAEYYYRQVIRLDQTGMLRKQAQRSLTLTGKSSEQAELPTPSTERATVDSDAAQPQPTTTVQEGMDGFLAKLRAVASRYREYDPDTLFAAGYRSYLALDYPRAFEYYGTYCVRRENDAAGWYALGETLLRLGNLVHGELALRKAANLAGKGTYLKQLGLCLQMRGRAEEARGLLSKALELGKKNGVVLTALAECALAMNDLEAAVGWFEEAIRASKTNMRARLGLAKALERRGEIDEAIRQLDEVLLGPVEEPLRGEAERLVERLKSQRSEDAFRPWA